MRPISVLRILLEKSGIVEMVDFTYIWPYRDLDLKVKVIKPIAEHLRILHVYIWPISDQNIWLERSGIVQNVNFFYIWPSRDFDLKVKVTKYR